MLFSFSFFLEWYCWKNPTFFSAQGFKEHSGNGTWWSKAIHSYEQITQDSPQFPFTQQPISFSFFPLHFTYLTPLPISFSFSPFLSSPSLILLPCSCLPLSFPENTCQTSGSQHREAEEQGWFNTWHGYWGASEILLESLSWHIKHICVKACSLSDPPAHSVTTAHGLQSTFSPAAMSREVPEPRAQGLYGPFTNVTHRSL